MEDSTAKRDRTYTPQEHTFLQVCAKILREHPEIARKKDRQQENNVPLG
jgi:hypothetical protein